MIEGRSPYPPAHSLPTGGDPTLDAVAIQDTFRFPVPGSRGTCNGPVRRAPLLRRGSRSSSSSRSPPSSWRCVCSVSWTGGATGSSSRRSPHSAPSGWEPSRRSCFWGSPSAWRFREKKLIVATAVGGLVLLKLFLWPLLIWLVLSRRVGSAALAVAIATAISLASLGRDRLRRPCELPGVAVHSGLLGREQGLVDCCARPLARAVVSRCKGVHARPRRFCARGRRSRAAREARSLVFHGRHSRGDPPFANRLAPLLPAVGGAARDRLSGAGACLVHPTRLVGVAVPGDRWRCLEDRARVGRAYRRVRDNAPVSQARRSNRDATRVPGRHCACTALPSRPDPPLGRPDCARGGAAERLRSSRGSRNSAR